MTLRRIAGLLSGVALLAALPSTVAAHELSTAGPFRIAVGWQSEPVGGTTVPVDQANAVQLFIDRGTSASGATPVGDLNADCAHPDLQVTVTVGTQTSAALCPQPAYDADTGRGRQDEYDVPLTPTAVGTWTFRVYGTVHGVSVDHTVASSPQTFDSVGNGSGTEFPTAAPALGDVAAKTDAVGTRAATALSAAQSAASTSSGAGDAATRATVISVVALVVALIALGALGLSRRRVRTPTS